MSVRAANPARATPYAAEGMMPGQQQQQQQQQQFSSSPYIPPAVPASYLQQMQAQQARAAVPMQQRPQTAEQQHQLQQQHQQQALARSSQVMQGMPGQLPPGYLQAQVMRQRQAAAAANWAMQQEQKNVHSQRLGSAILRLLNFSEQLNSFSESSSLPAWKKFVDMFYIDPALCTVSLPIDPSLSYELPTPLLSNYYYNLHKEVVKLALTFHDAKEYYIPPASHVVVCPLATLCYYFPNETKVEMLGRLKVVFSPGSSVNPALKIENWEFVGETWEEWVCRQPPEPNRVMRGEANGDLDGSSSDKDNEETDKTNDKAKKTVREPEEPVADEGHRGNNDDDHEDLFGRSPSASVPPVPSRPVSRSNSRTTCSKKERTLYGGADLTKRKRMVMESGITPGHMRLLEISDVLGQLSPLIGRKNPKTALAELLATLPPSPEQAERKKAAVQTEADTTRKQSNTAQASEQPANSKEPARAGLGNGQCSTSHISGRAMQQQASQVLQKQAAQTLSQALPPPDLEVAENREPAPEDDEDDAMHETDDFFMPPELDSSTTENNVVKEEEKEVIDTEKGAQAVGGIDLDLDLDAQGERDSEFDVSADFAVEVTQTNGASGNLKVTPATSKREGDQVLGRGKRARKSEDE